MKRKRVADSVRTVLKNGTILWRDKEGKRHRVDGPAVITPDGIETWYLHGETHREGGPAVTWSRGEYWYRNGRKHREGGPAVTNADGLEEWYIHGKLHRDNGPAQIHPQGDKSWYRRGKLHREDGPAYEGADGTKLWFRDDKKLTEQEFNTLREKELTAIGDAFKTGRDDKTTVSHALTYKKR